MRFGIFRGRFSPGGPFLLINYPPNEAINRKTVSAVIFGAASTSNRASMGWGNQLRHLRIFIRADADEDRKWWPV